MRNPRNGFASGRATQKLEKRACGPCTACCVAFKIKAPELRKKAGVRCPHLCASGCGIYAARPGVCRDFLCGWRLFEEFDDSWRPDVSGIMVLRLAPAELPPAWRHASHGVVLLALGGEAAVLRPAVLSYVARQLERQIPVFLSAASPSLLLNDHLDGRDLDHLEERMKALYGLIHAAKWERGRWRVIVFLYRLQLDRYRRKMQAASNS